MTDAATEHSVPALLLVAMVFRESSFRTGLVGTRGEVGLMQVGEDVARFCNCDLTTPAGQVMCGACGLRHGIDRCGTIEGGLTAYATKGGKCDPDHSGNPRRVRRAVDRRLNLWEKLKEVTR